MIWDDIAINELKYLWWAGHSTAEIGRRMGISKNAVVGKAHRVEGLDGRPTPIKYAEGVEPGSRLPRPTRPLQPPAPLPMLPSLREPPPPVPMAVSIAVPAARRAAPIVPAPVSDYRPPIQPPPAPIPVIRHRRPSAICCWPIGMPGTKAFKFCDGTAVSGKPYCDDHAKLAYVKVRDRKEDAL